MIRVLSLFLLLFVFSPFSNAEEVKNLFEIEVIAESTRPEHKLAAMKKAFTLVLERVIAGEDIASHKILLGLIDRAPEWVEEYQYSLLEQNETENRLLRVRFNEQAIVDTLRASQLSYWNEIRPPTLVWLVVEDQGNRLFLDPASMPQVQGAMNYAIQLKKIPVIYPVQDLSEKRTLSVSDVLSAYSDHLLDVSVRYDVVSTLAGKLVNNSGCWSAEWTHYFDDKIKQWSSACGTLNEVALDGLTGVYKTLSVYYAAKPDLTDLDLLRIKVSGIMDTEQLKHLQQYLEAIPEISLVTRYREDRQYYFFRVFFHGTQEQLKARLLRDKRLIPELILDSMEDSDMAFRYSVSASGFQKP